MNLKQTIVSDMTAAMKAKDAARTSTLRMVKAALMNREIAKGVGQELTEDEVVKTLQALVKQRKDSIEQYEAANRSDLADKERAELSVIAVYLPQEATRAELEQVVGAVIAELGTVTVREMGTVMKAAQAQLVGKSFDGKVLSDVVKARLTA